VVCRVLSKTSRPVALMVDLLAFIASSTEDGELHHWRQNDEACKPGDEDQAACSRPQDDLTLAYLFS
jgi:hypothetical protein